MLDVRVMMFDFLKRERSAVKYSILEHQTSKLEQQNIS